MLDTVVRWWFSRGDAHIWSSSIFYRWIFTYGMLDGVEIGVLDVFGWFDCMHRFCKLGVVNRMMDVREFPSFCLFFFGTSHITCVFFQEGMLLTGFLSATATWISWISLHFRTLVRWKGICFLKKRLVGDTRWFSQSLRRFDLHYV